MQLVAVVEIEPRVVIRVRVRGDRAIDGESHEALAPFLTGHDEMVEQHDRAIADAEAKSIGDVSGFAAAELAGSATLYVPSAWWISVAVGRWISSDEIPNQRRLLPGSTLRIE